jgi:dTDP-4-dehydrorhamnose reductase
MPPLATRSSNTQGCTLILGGSGFLGAHAVAAALRTGRPVVSASRDPGAGGDGAERRVLDALHPQATQALLAELAPARIVLCTALARLDQCDAYPGLAQELNVAFPERVARAATAQGARLVFVSTDLVFGAVAPPSSGFVEAHDVGPVSCYGESKAAGERAVLEALPDALVVRLPLMFGDSLGRGLGATDSLLAAIGRGMRPTLFEDEYRTPLDVGVAGRALVELLDADVSGVLHVAGRQRISRHELGLALLTAAGHKPVQARAAVVAGTRQQAGLEASRPADVSLDASRARELLSVELPGPPG